MAAEIEVTEYLGTDELQLGNDDLADSCAWHPPGEPENPGHLCTEHTRSIAMPWLTERRADLIFVGLAVVGIYMGMVS